MTRSHSPPHKVSSLSMIVFLSPIFLSHTFRAEFAHGLSCRTAGLPAMKRMLQRVAVGLFCFFTAAGLGAAERFDVVIVGGIMAAIATARGGHTAVILDRNKHIGGLPANGLGATDIHTRGATAGLFVEFVDRVRRHYVDTYGPDSQEVKDCSDGYHFEPSVAEAVFERMIAEFSEKITVRRLRQFDAMPENVVLSDGAIRQITVTCRDRQKTEKYDADVFIDATYEGDLAAAAGVPYRLGREGKDEFDEPMAGRLYKHWGGPVGPGSTGLADNAVQAFNFRLCLTRQKDDQVATASVANEWIQRAAVNKPTDYKPAETTRGELLGMLLQSVRSKGQVDHRGRGLRPDQVHAPRGGLCRRAPRRQDRPGTPCPIFEDARRAGPDLRSGRLARHRHQSRHGKRLPGRSGRLCLARPGRRAVGPFPCKRHFRQAFRRRTW